MQLRHTFTESCPSCVCVRTPCFEGGERASFPQPASSASLKGMSASKQNAAGAGRWLWALACTAIMYAFFLISSLRSSDDFECITNSWCLDAPQDSPLIAFFRTLGVVLVFLAMILTLRACGYLLARGWMLLVGGMVMVLLGLAAFWIFFFAVDPAERPEIIHILVIGGLGILMGAPMVYANVAAKWKK